MRAPAAGSAAGLDSSHSPFLLAAARGASATRPATWLDPDGAIWSPASESASPRPTDSNLYTLDRYMARRVPSASLPTCSRFPPTPHHRWSGRPTGSPARDVVPAAAHVAPPSAPRSPGH